MHFALHSIAGFLQGIWGNIFDTDISNILLLILRCDSTFQLPLQIHIAHDDI